MSQTKAQLIDTLVASLLPASDSSVDIGSNAVRFANIYGDTLYGSGANLTGLNIVTDTSPQLGGNLDVNTKNILFGDSSDGASDDVLIFGAGSDLKIYHSGSHSIIQETGTGNLLLCGTRVNILNSATSETLISAQENGPVELYYDNSKKFETLTDGVKISGKTLSLINPSNFQDNTFTLEHGSSTVGNKHTIDFKDQNGSSTQIISYGSAFGSSKDNALEIKTSTTSNGDPTTRLTFFEDGKIQLPDNGKATFGTGDDLQIYHDGTASFITNTTGGLNLEDTGGYFRVKSDDIKLEAANGEDFLECDANGAVSLYFNASKKFQTTNGGINITGSVACSGGASNNLSLPDNGKAKFGTGDDLQIYHDGTHSYIANSTNNLYVNAPNFFHLGVSNGGEKYLTATENGAVELYYDNVKTFATKAGGNTLYGTDASGNVSLGRFYFKQESGTVRALYDPNAQKFQHYDNTYATFGNGDDLKIYHDGGGSYIANSTGILRLQAKAGENSISLNPDGAVELYHDHTQRFETVSNGFRLVHSTGNVDFHFNRLIVNAGQTFFIDHTATGADFQFRTSDSSGLDTTALQIIGSGCLYNRCRSGSQANLTLRKQITGANGIDYLQTRNQNNDLRTAIKGNGGISNFQSNDTNLSDETVKKNIVDCESIIEKFKQWKLRKFNYNSDSDGTPLTYGLIAQEIETLHSDLVSADFPVNESGKEVMKKSVKDHQLMMLSFKALQEAIAKIEVLEAKVAALEAA